MEEEKTYRLFDSDDEQETQEPAEAFVPLDDGEDTEPAEHPRRPVGPILLLVVLSLLVVVSGALLVGLLMRRGEEAPEGSQAVSQEISEESVGEISLPVAEMSENASSEPELSEPETSEPETSEPEEPAHGWVINAMGYTYLYHGVGVEQFNYSAATLEKYLNGIRTLAQKVPEGTAVYCMPVPTRIGFLYEEISDEIKREDNFFNSWQEGFLDTVGERLSPDVSTVDLFESFQSAYGEDTELFFRTDRNWTADAAYLAYLQYCEACGLAPVSLDVYEEKQIEGFLGSFYTATQSESLRRNADTFRYYRNADTDACKVTVYSNGNVYRTATLAGNATGDASGAYNVYLGGGGQSFRIQSPCTSGRRLLVVGDGSAAAMLPFLIENYTEIRYVDVASYPGDFAELFADGSFHDVLFLSYVTNTVKGENPPHLSALAGIETEDGTSNG